MAMAGLVFPEFAFELDNPCRCEGCCRKISKVINRLEGVYEFRFEQNRLVLTGRNIDPSNVIRRLSEVKKHARFIGMAFPHHQLPPHPPPPAEQPPPCMADQHCAHHQVPVHPCCTNEPPPPPPACHCPHSPHFNEPPPPQLPPPSSAFHCPPPLHHECNHGHGHPLPHHQILNDPPAAELDNFLHRPTSPLIPQNACPVELLNQLGNIQNLKQVDLIKKQGIKLTFEDGHVRSWHPTYSMELRPGFCRDPLHLQPRYVSPFSDEDPNAYCSIM